MAPDHIFKDLPSLQAALSTLGQQAGNVPRALTLQPDEQAQLAGLVPPVAVDVLLLLPLLLVRGDLGLEEASRGGAEGLVVLGEQGARHHGRHGLGDVQVTHGRARYHLQYVRTTCVFAEGD